MLHNYKYTIFQYRMTENQIKWQKKNIHIKIKIKEKSRKKFKNIGNF